VLGLGMLGCMNRAFNLLREHKNVDVGMADLQDDDPAVFGMIQREAAMLAFIKSFRLLGFLFFAMIPLVFLMRKPRHKAGPGAGMH